MTTDSREQLLRDMVRIRRIEETLAELYPAQEMRTPTHFSIGQEAVAVGVCAALRRTDVVYSGHRCHAHYLAKGGDLRGMVAELYGRETGCARGRGGSVHLNDPDAGVIASSAILGQTMAVAVGTALAFSMDRRDDVAVSFFGDGTVEEGIFHETLNFAVDAAGAGAVRVREQRLLDPHAASTCASPRRSRSTSAAPPTACRRAWWTATTSSRSARRPGRRWPTAVAATGPFFLECTTYRWREHVGPLWDYDKGYRTKAEVDSWIARCPIRRASERLAGRRRLHPGSGRRVRAREPERGGRGGRGGEDGTLPGGGRSHAGHVLRTTMRRLTYGQAISEATVQCMEADPSIFVAGIGVDDFKGIFGTTADAYRRFGPERVFDIPNGENAMTGIAIGAAAVGQAAARRASAERLHVPVHGPALQPRRQVALHVRQPRAASRWCSAASWAGAGGRAPRTPRACRRCSPTSPGSTWACPPRPPTRRGCW